MQSLFAMANPNPGSNARYEAAGIHRAGTGRSVLLTQSTTAVFLAYSPVAFPRYVRKAQITDEMSKLQLMHWLRFLIQELKKKM